MFDAQLYIVALTTDPALASNSRTVYVVRYGDGIEAQRQVRQIPISRAEQTGRPILQQVFDPAEADWFIKIVD
ncbi:MAG: hypothetical protein ACPG7F_02560 [Aggregatilineales bacterium]